MGSSLRSAGSEASLRRSWEVARWLLGDAVRPVVDFIYPPRCPACGDALGAQSGLCVPCWDQIATPSSEATSDIVAATAYGDVSRKLLLGFKHGGRIALAPLMARLMAGKIPGVDSSRLIVPVPLHPSRLWKRGYNQSALLGAELARLGHGRLVVDGLLRVRRTPPLERRSASERKALLDAAIVAAPRRAASLRGADILLVDDVVTSGATTQACRQALRKAGAGDVTVICFARVEPGSRPPRRCDAHEHHAAAAPLPPTINARDHAIPGVP